MIEPKSVCFGFGSAEDEGGLFMGISALFLSIVGISIAGCGPEAIVISGKSGQIDVVAGKTTSALTPSGTATKYHPAAKPRAEITSKVSFRDVAQARGLLHTWPEQPRPMTALQAFGSGCAAFDGDNDGWQDVLLVCDPHPKLFRNLGGARFEDVTQASGLAKIEGDWTGCAAGDYNGDGLLDLLVTGYHCLALCKNLGGLQFQIVTEEAGLDSLNEGHWGASAGFMDLDGDQWLDLVILNYVAYGPDSRQYCEYRPGVISGCNPREEYPPEQGRIWRNTGSGRFEPVPQSQAMESTQGVGLVLAFSDADADGRIDFYIGNDGKPAELMHNLGNMHFENVAQAAGVDAPEHGAAAAMGADWGDYDGDGIPDLVITDWQGLGSVLYRGLGSMLFLNRSVVTSLTRNTANRMGFGAKWIDFDNDGWQDLFFVNGHVYDNSTSIDGPGAPFRQSICLLMNDRGKKFVDILDGLEDDVKRTIIGRGSATADFNNDGHMDLLAVDFEGAVMLLENRTVTTHHWLKIELRGKGPNSFAYGARVTGRSRDRVWITDVSPTSSYLSSSDPRIHWGLGKLQTIDSITIKWPSGTQQTLTQVSADHVLKVIEENSSPVDE